MKDVTQHITFVTGNSRKVEEATAVLAEYAIDVTPLALELDEIQHHDPLKITEAKARAAYQAAGRPIVVNDSNWEIPALGGFPGGYMKDVAIWFRPEDFLALMRDKADRRVILHDVVVYYDGNVMQCFTFDQVGVFTKEARGSRQPYANNNVIAMEGSGGLTIAEVFDSRDKGVALDPNHYAHWQQFGAWMNAQSSRH